MSVARDLVLAAKGKPALRTTRLWTRGIQSLLTPTTTSSSACLAVPIDIFVAIVQTVTATRLKESTVFLLRFCSKKMHSSQNFASKRGDFPPTGTRCEHS